MQLPLEISTVNGTEKIILGKEKIVINSSTIPEIDPRGWYLKKLEIN